MRIERIGERDARDGGAHIAREVGLGLLADQPPADYEAIAREAEAAGIDVISVFHDLLYQPALGAVAPDGAGDGARQARPGGAEPVHAAPVRDRRPDGDARPRLAAAAPISASSRALARPARARGGAAVAGAAGGGRDRAEAPRRRHERRRGRALHARCLARRSPTSACVRGAAADRHVGRANGRLGGDRRRRDQDRRLGESRPRAGGAGLGSGAGTADRRRLRHRRRRGRRLGAGAGARRGGAVLSTSSRASTRRSSFARREEPPLDRFAIAGTPEEVAARVIELWEAGADRVELGTPQGRTTREGVRADLRPRAAAVALTRAPRPRRAGRRRRRRPRSAATRRARARAGARRSASGARRRPGCRGRRAPCRAARCGGRRCAREHGRG